MRVSSAWPLNKVTGAAITGALLTVFLWLLKTYANVEVPVEVQGALTVLLSFAVAYFIPLNEGEVTPVEE